MLRTRLLRPGLAVSVLVALAVAVLLVPALGAGAEERRDRRGDAEETPDVVIAQIATAPPDATAEPESVDDLAVESGDPKPEPQPDNVTCPEDWEQPATVSDDVGCLPQTATGDGATGAIAAATATATPTVGNSVISGHVDPDILPPAPAPPHHACPPGYHYELLLEQNADRTLTWLYACVADAGDPTGPDEVSANGGSEANDDVIDTIVTLVNVRHPDHGCPEGYVQKLLLRENPDGTLTWLYACVPDGSGPTGPGDETGTGDNGRPGGSPPIAPTDGLSATGGGSEGGGDGCPADHHWTDGPLEFPDWPVDTDGDGYLDSTDTVVVHGGCVPDSGQCPDGSAIHPYYTEYGCILYGSGPWAG